MREHRYGDRRKSVRQKARVVAVGHRKVDPIKALRRKDRLGALVKRVVLFYKRGRSLCRRNVKSQQGNGSATNAVKNVDVFVADSALLHCRGKRKSALLLYPFRAKLLAVGKENPAIVDAVKLCQARGKIHQAKNRRRVVVGAGAVGRDVVVRDDCLYPKGRVVALPRKLYVNVPLSVNADYGAFHAPRAKIGLDKGGAVGVGPQEHFVFWRKAGRNNHRLSLGLLCVSAGKKRDDFLCQKLYGKGSGDCGGKNQDKVSERL